jgi:hypothetical protein
MILALQEKASIDLQDISAFESGYHRTYIGMLERGV